MATIFLIGLLIGLFPLARAGRRLFIVLFVVLLLLAVSRMC